MRETFLPLSFHPSNSSSVLPISGEAEEGTPWPSPKVSFAITERSKHNSVRSPDFAYLPVFVYPFRRHVVGCPYQGVCGGGLVTEKPPQSQVTKLHHTLSSYKHIGWLDICNKTSSAVRTCRWIMIAIFPNIFMCWKWRFRLTLPTCSKGWPKGCHPTVPTSVHDPLGVHVFQRAAQLYKILPDGPFRNESLLFFEMLDHSSGIRCGH